MNYKRHYDALIERARIRQLSGYVERHHIVPKCMGGGNEPANIVRLTAEEHFVAHQLLVKMFPEHRGLIGWLRRRFSAMISETLKGRIRSPETRAKISAAQLGKKRGPYSDVIRARMSKASKGKPKSEAHRAALSKAKLGKKRKPHSEETKEKIRASNIERSKTQDRSYTQSPEYKQAQRDSMIRIWAERKRLRIEKETG